MTVNFEAEAKILRTRPGCLQAETETKNHEAKTNAEIMAWSRGLNIPESTFEFTIYTDML